jgi:ribosomal protein L3 glutamine methyltransferase
MNALAQRKDDLLSHLQTIGDWIRFSTSLFEEQELFFGHGTETAWDEAVALVLQTLNLSNDVAPSIFQCNLTAYEKQMLFLHLIERVEKRRPLPYITNKAWFSDIEFYVDERVLIPRSPIAEIIQNGFEPWIGGRPVSRILDLCTGSGCIAIACAIAFPEALVDGSDISPDALEVAKRNVEHYGLDSQVTLIESDGLEQVSDRYDIIVSNPPYVDAEDMSKLPDEFKHEPELALASGHDGLDFVSNVLKSVDGHLNDNGILIVEVGNSYEALCDKYPQVPFLWLTFENGGHGVFLLTKEQIKQFKSFF